MTIQSENPVELTDSDLQKSYWFLTHRDPLKRKITYVLGFFSCAVFLLGLTGGANILISDLFTSKNLKASLLEGRVYHGQAELVPPLSILDTGVLSNLDGTTDFYASVQNPTTDWYVKTDVVFHLENTLQKKVSLILFPGDTRYALLLGQKYTGASTLFSSSLQNTTWKRMTPHEKRLLFERRKFTVDNIKFSPYDSSRVDSPSFAQLQFDFTNESVYGFWEVPIPIVVISDSKVAGVNAVIVPRVGPREKRVIDIRWTSGNQLNASFPTFSIDPVINVLDESLYQPQQGVPQR